MIKVVLYEGEIILKNNKSLLGVTLLSILIVGCANASSIPSVPSSSGPSSPIPSTSSSRPSTSSSPSAPSNSTSISSSSSISSMSNSSTITSSSSSSSSPTSLSSSSSTTISSPSFSTSINSSSFSSSIIPSSSPTTSSSTTTTETSNESQTLALAKEKLLNKDYFPFEFNTTAIKSKPNKRNFNISSSFNLQSDINDDLENVLYPENFHYPSNNSVSYSLAAIGFFKNNAEMFKNYLDNMILLVEAFGVYQQLEEQNVYFKLVSDDFETLESLHFYVIDFEESSFAYYRLYNYQGRSALEISISTSVISPSSETLTSTTTFQNIDDSIIRVMVMSEFIYEGLESFGKFVNSEMYEFKVIDESKYEINVLGMNSTMVSNDQNEIISIERTSLEVTKTVVSPTHIFSTLISNRSDLIGRFTIEYLPDPNDRKNFFSINFNQSGVHSIYTSLKLFENLNYVTYEAPSSDDFFQNLIATSITTDETTIDLTTTEFDLHLNKGRLPNTYTMQFGSIFFSSIEDMFEALRPVKTTYDLENIYLNRAVLIEDIQNTLIYDVNFFSMNVNQWLNYLDTNYFNFNNPALQLFEPNADNDFIRPFITGPATILKTTFEEMSPDELKSLITVIDDQDGPIEVTEDNISILYENDKPQSILFSVSDKANNMSQFVITIL